MSPASPETGMSETPASSHTSPSTELGPDTILPVARRMHTKSRTGCKPCKERKVKCDEKRPYCSNCVRHFFQPSLRCTYDESLSRAVPSRSQSRKTSPSKLPSPPRDVKLPNRPRPSLKNNVGENRLDPFETHPQTPAKEADVDLLMKHYFSTIVFNMFPYYPAPGKNPQTEFYAPLIWTDPVLFHVTLQLSAFRLERLYPRRGSSQSHRLHTESLRLLRERFEGSPGTSACDQTISAVAGLAAIEHEKGNMRIVQMHMNGLHRMLVVRGGINAIRRSNAMVANIVFCMFIAADEPFPEIDTHTDEVKPQWYRNVLPLVEQRPYVDLEACGVSSEFAAVMKDIRLLAQCYRTADDTESAEEYLSVLTFLCSSMQRILSLPLPTTEDSRVINVTKACRSAMILHVFSQWCGHQPDPSIMVSAAQHSLKCSLRPLMLQGTGNSLLLWLLSCGAIASRGAPERTWFIGHLAAMVEEMGIESWAEMRKNLMGIVWHEIQDEDTHRIVWEDVESMQNQRI